MKHSHKSGYRAIGLATIAALITSLFASIAVAQQLTKAPPQEQAKKEYKRKPAPIPASCRYFDLWTLKESPSMAWEYGYWYLPRSDSGTGFSLTSLVGVQWENFAESGPVAITWDADFPWYVDQWLSNAWSTTTKGSVLHFPILGKIHDTYQIAGFDWYKYTGNFGPTGATVELNTANGEAIMELPMGTEWIRYGDEFIEWPSNGTDIQITKLRMTALDSGKTMTCTYDTSWAP